MNPINQTTFVILPEHELIIERFEGDVNRARIEEASKAIWAEADYDARFSGYADLRGANLMVNLKDIIKLARFFATSPKRARGRLALIVDRGEGAGKARMFQNRMTSVFRIRVYTSLEEASNYLGSDPSYFDLINGDRAKVI